MGGEVENKAKLSSISIEICQLELSLAIHTFVNDLISSTVFGISGLINLLASSELLGEVFCHNRHY